MKKAGILDGMKSTLRGRLYEQLRNKAQPSAGSGYLAKEQSKENKLAFKIAVSMVADLMQKCEMPYALSVFLPESGVQ